jgi:putative peptide zinc metalloprotease protein
VRLAERLAAPIVAVMRREVPAATEHLPSLALGAQGGGDIATDPFDTHGTKAIRKLFLFDFELPSQAGVVNVGGRVHVRFDHGWEPLGLRWYREMRRLFLSKFHV